MNPELERIWPDEDRRDVALERVLLRTLADKVFLVDRLNRPDKGTVAYIAAKALVRIRAEDKNLAEGTART